MTPLVIFDGACGLCTWTVRLAGRWDTARRWSFVPFQRLTDAEFRALGVSRAACAKVVHAIDVHGHVTRGAFAVNAVLATLPATRPFVAIVRLLFPLLLLEIAGYAFVAHNRALLSRMLGTTECALYDN